MRLLHAIRCNNEDVFENIRGRRIAGVLKHFAISEKHPRIPLSPCLVKRISLNQVKRTYFE